MCPATGSKGSTSPRYRSAARTSSTVTAPARRPASTTSASASRSTGHGRGSTATARRGDAGPRFDRPSPRTQRPVEERARPAGALEHPPQPSRERAARVVVGHDRTIAADPGGSERACERLGARQGVPAGPGRRVAREVPIDVEQHRARDVPGLEVADRRGGAPCRRPAHIDEIDFISMPGEPVGVDEQRHRSVTITGAWSLGLPSPVLGLRSSRSTTTVSSRDATDAVPSTRSIRSPHPLWNAPAV